MKATLNTPTTNEFPKLMCSDKLVVMFLKKDCGIVVYPDSLWEIGYYSENWTHNVFKDYNGTITLSN